MPISNAALLPILAIAAVVTLVGCGRTSDPATGNAAIAQAEAAAASQAEDDGHILCARGAAPLQRTCTVEQTQGQGGLILTLRHPDGGFRRLQVTRDGRGVIAADGADVAKVALAGPADIEVTVGDDRYRLPATIKPSARPS